MVTNINYKRCSMQQQKHKILRLMKNELEVLSDKVTLFLSIWFDEAIETSIYTYESGRQTDRKLHQKSFWSSQKSTCWTEEDRAADYAPSTWQACLSFSSKGSDVRTGWIMIRISKDADDVVDREMLMPILLTVLWLGFLFSACFQGSALCVQTIL
jgi:hypothetical protein